MKAIVITKKGGPEVLVMQDVPKPQPMSGEVMVKVQAAGLNRSDIYSRISAGYGAAGPEIPGLEVAGTVEAVGSMEAASTVQTQGSTQVRWKVGDRVCALVNGGGYAEYVTVPGAQCLPVPAGMDMIKAAALPETICTVWHNVFRVAALQPGENLLVHGGSSGIGVTAIQLGKALGSPVYVTAGTDEKCRWCESIGAAKAVNYKTENFGELLKHSGIDVILDMTGGDFTPINIGLLRTDGRIVYINAMRGRQATIDLAEIMRKRILLTGSHLKPRDAAFKAALTKDVEEHVWPLVAKNAVAPFIYATFPLSEAAEAQTLMESSRHIGKIVLTMI